MQKFFSIILFTAWLPCLGMLPSTVSEQAVATGASCSALSVKTRDGEIINLSRQDIANLGKNNFCARLIDPDPQIARLLAPDDHPYFEHVTSQAMRGIMQISTLPEANVIHYLASLDEQAVYELQIACSFLQCFQNEPKNSLIARATFEHLLARLGNEPDQETKDYVNMVLRLIKLVPENATDNINILDSTYDREVAPRVWHLLSSTIGGLTCAALSPDNRIVATGQQDGQIIFWSTETGKPIKKIYGHDEEITSIAYNRNGTRLATGSWNWTKIWNTQTGEPVRQMEVSGWTTNIIFAHNDEGLITRSYHGAPEMRDLATGQLIGTYHHEKLTTCMALSRNGQTLAVGQSGGLVNLWRVADSTLVQTLHAADTEDVRAIAFSPDDQIMTITTRNTILIHTPAEEQRNRFDDNIQGLSSDGLYLVTQSSRRFDNGRGIEYGTLTLRNATTGQPLQQFDFSGYASCTFNANNTHLVIAQGIDKKTFDILDVATGHRICQCNANLSGIDDVSFSSDSTQLTSKSYTDRWVWDTQTGTPIQQRAERAEARFDHATAVMHNGTTRAISRWDFDNHEIELWDIAKNTKIAGLTGHTKWVTNLTFSHNGTVFASGSLDHTARVWDMQTRTCIHTFLMPDPVSALAFSPNDALLATGSEDHKTRIWDIKNEKLLAEFERHTADVTSLTFNADGTLLATGSRDCTAKIWQQALARKHTNFDEQQKLLLIKLARKKLSPEEQSALRPEIDALSANPAAREFVELCTREHEQDCD